MRRPLAALVLVPLLAASLPVDAVPDGPARLIVGYHEAAARDVAALEALGLDVARVPPATDFVVVEAREGRAAAAALQRLEGVRYVEVDHPLVLEAAPNDLYWDQQWGPQAIAAPAAWDIVAGSEDVVYAVVDTGVDYLHPDLVLNMWQNDDLPNTLDDDGNGYVDDTFGIDCAAGDSDPYSPGQYHGTHVAGIAAATKDNVVGVAGVAQVRIMALKVFQGAGFGGAAAAAECIRYAADNGARVLGMSWFTQPSTAIDEALAYAWANDVVIFKSAGNQNGGPVTYPGTRPEVIAVSALSSASTRASYSSVGAKVELAAPGSSILNTVTLLSPAAVSATPGFNSLSGTSMAQPHAAGVAALVLSKNPDLTNQQVRDILASTADDLGAAGRDPYFGHGRINAHRAVLAA